ncbi:sensor histidine kinase [Leptolyngbya sp. PCC 6406]|uniref:sensor histidine kinase n=1 Tax=Leptolyngbya sp. PCC 6406 TaxID=1173264 RepID=UPI0002ACE2F9|nr:ATP-binding protein [Leptolyngbya sp. PCC 6406]
MSNPHPEPDSVTDSITESEYDELATLAEAESFALGTKSVLAQLPLWEASLDIGDPGHEAAHLFEGEPTLPGIILTDGKRSVGMLSRQRFLEYLLRPKGIDLFLAQPLRVMYSYARLPPLVLAHTTPILAAAQLVLRRPLDQQGEPLVVTSPRGDRLVHIHDLNRAHWQIRGIETQVRYERVQAQMLQSEKMAALGRLVDGVSHEILDPLGFIWGNLAHLGRYCQQLLDLIAVYEESVTLPSEAVALLREDIELDYLQEDLPNTIRSIQGGADRLKRLALSLQNFCHIDDIYPKPADLHELLDSVVLLLKSRLTTQIEVVRDYDPLPPVTCFGGQLSQVFMNILTNCLDALLERTSRQDASTNPWEAAQDGQSLEALESPKIIISTSLCRPPQELANPGQRWISVVIADNGPGLSPAAQEEVLRSFSIEKRLEKETHLAMSYRIITAKHGGRFYVRSRSFSDHETAPGIGTEFEIRLPLYPQGD